MKFEKPFIALLFSTFFLTAASSIIAPIESRFIQTLNADPAVIGFTLSIPSIVFIIISPLIGRLSVKYGLRKLTLYSIWFSVVIPIVYASSQNILQYMGAKLGYGLTAVVFGPIMYSILQYYISDRKESRGQLSGFYFSAQAIGGSLASFMGGFIADSFFLAAPYYAMAVFTLLSALSMHFVDVKEKIEVPRYHKPFQLLRYLIKDKTVRFTFIFSSMASMHWGMRAVIFPLFIFSMTGANFYTGLLYSSMGLLAMFTLPMAGHLLDKKGIRVSIYAIAVLAISSLLMAFSNNFLFFYLFSLLYVIGEAFNGTTLSYVDVSHLPEQIRKELISLRASLFALVSFIAPFLAGLVLKYSSYQVVLLLFSSFFWILLFYTLFLFGRGEL
ncbi:hypothetical protein DRN74_01775 [Candidatus Micrarchaeota archaeon]|nr:MAG: hypothetical protein DRN74_01775 [Candidatus Micrarchaeota archaeon]